jgi:hypothetical protein
MLAILIWSLKLIHAWDYHCTPFIYPTETTIKTYIFSFEIKKDWFIAYNKVTWKNTLEYTESFLLNFLIVNSYFINITQIKIIICLHFKMARRCTKTADIWMFMSPKLHLLKSWPSRWLYLKVGQLGGDQAMRVGMEISALEDASEKPLAPCTMWGHSHKIPSVKKLAFIRNKICSLHNCEQ